MHISDTGLELIRHFEGFSPTIYICAGGYPTIGYGHVVRAHEYFDVPLSQAHALTLLREDVKKAEQGVQRYIDSLLSQSQFDALTSFTFNLGVGALQRSTLRRKVNRESHHEVPQEFHHWVFAGGRKLRGLVRRRAAEAKIYSSNVSVSHAGFTLTCS